MAYPVLTDVFRAQVVMQHVSGLPEDVFVNNLYFHKVGASSDPTTMASDIAVTLEDFYSAGNGPGGEAVNYFLSNGIASAAYKIYDLGAAAPRYPVVPAIAASWAGTAATQKLPTEVACCLSFKGGNLPREKGRIYLGPLNEYSVDAGPPVQVSDDCMETFGNAASAELLNPVVPIQWVVVSPTYASWVPVTETWVDNAFDTQRSRGTAATERLRWGPSGPLP